MLMKFLLLWQPWGRWFRFRKDGLRCGTLFLGYRHSSLLVGIEGFQGQGQLMPVVSTFSFLCGEFLVTQLSAWHRKSSLRSRLHLILVSSYVTKLSTAVSSLPRLRQRSSSLL